MAGASDGETATAARPRVAAIIPAWNEAASIGLVVAALPRRFVDDIVVVDGGSDDGTAAVARAAGARVVGQDRPGYGAACAAGVRAAVAAGATVLVFLDGDYADDPADLPLVLGPVLAGRADLALGTRLARRERGALPAHQLAGNRVAVLLIALLYRRRLRDIGSFRAIRADRLAALGMAHPTYGWPVEMVVKALRRGYRVVEAPVHYRRRLGRAKVGGTLRGSVLAGYHMLHTILVYARDEATETVTGT
ncbi:MAG TPA: glycosyltransferase family 2 protein [Thermomicrobiales bacterium]|nr:glycosyltransferase family 2 protein [Thermomicrobiales bacterium]